MSGVYTPTPTQSQTYTEAQDGNDKDAGSVETFSEALADGLARLTLEAFHWTAKGSLAQKEKRGAYNKIWQAWYVIGDGGLDFLEISQDHGRTWVDKTGTIGLTASEQNHDIAFSAAGVGVIIANGSSRNVYSEDTAGINYAADSFGHTVNALSHVCDGGQIEYDEPHTKWIVVYRSGAAGMKANNSTNGTAYTDQSANLPAAWTAYTGTTQAPAVHVNASGVALAVFFDDGAGVSKWRTATSINGGANWTATTQGGGAFAAGGSLGVETIGKPAYDEILGDWYIVGGRTTGTDSSDVWRSSDNGATWTNVYSNAAGLAFQDLVAFNGILVAVNVDGRIFASVDRGVTWTLTGRNVITTPARPFMRLQNGQLLVINSEDKATYASLRLGAAGGSDHG